MDHEAKPRSEAWIFHARLCASRNPVFMRWPALGFTPSLQTKSKDFMGSGDSHYVCDKHHLREIRVGSLKSTFLRCPVQLYSKKTNQYAPILFQREPKLFVLCLSYFKCNGVGGFRC